MYVCDDFIYIQLHKTGSTHIASLMQQLFNGRFKGKHNPATPAQLQKTPVFISSIRNPWTWHLSLWSYGFSGYGLLYWELVKQRSWLRNKFAPGNFFRHPWRTTAYLFADIMRNSRPWKEVYGLGDHIEGFRQWLRMLYAPQYSRHLPERYGRSPHRDFSGFMTHRYLTLCCENTRLLADISDNRELAAFERENCYIDYFIRLEALEETLIETLEHIRPLTPEEKDLVYRTKKKNASSRKHTTAAYYDQASIDLVASREWLIIDKFGYRPPSPGG